MIAKVPEKRNDGRSSFSSLGRYLAGEKLDRETGEIVRSTEDIHLETNCLSVKTASAEMRAVADQNARVKDPVYHCILSWREGEKPTNDQVHAAAMAAMKSIEMEGHQFVLAVHRDSDNIHVHIMVNRINPETYLAVYPKQDFFKLDRCMRETELIQGWQHDNGPYVVADGQIVRARREQEAPPLPIKARDMEAATGCESLLTYAQQASGELVKALDKGGWQELHAVLRQHGLEIREAGQGFKIYDLADPTTTPVKASDVAGELGGGKLKKRLGEFQKPLRTVQAEKPAKTYNPYREKRQAGRDERSEARAAARLELRKRFDGEKRERLARQQALREGEQFALRDLSSKTRTERERIKVAGLSAEDRRARLSVLAMTTAAERERIKLQGKAEREAERMKGYRTWCSEQASQGDAAAIAQLKGREYQESRRRSAAEKAEEAAAELGAIRAEQVVHDTPAKPVAVLDGVAWQVDRRTGDVTYQLLGRAVLRDTGRQVAVLQPTDDKSIEAGLRLAAQKFGAELKLSGPAEFQQRCIQLAVEKGLGVKFADPAAETYRLQLVKLQREAGKSNHQEIKNGKQQGRDASDHRSLRRHGEGKGREGR